MCGYKPNTAYNGCAMFRRNRLHINFKSLHRKENKLQKKTEYNFSEMNKWLDEVS